MQPLFSSFVLVAVSEMGDKTQLLALVLALRFKRPWLVMLGILAATLLNHGLASALGGWVGSQVSESALRTTLAVVFLAFAVWMLFPDRLDDERQEPGTPTAWRAFVTTATLFFLAEMGDKTQLATLALGARFQEPLLVTIGTTLGMLAADGLAVFCGERLTRVVPMRAIRVVSALAFAAFGIAVFLG